MKRPLSVVSIVSVLFLVSYHYVFTDLNVDSGWYSYPAYALSKGGDPNENQLTLKELPDDSRLFALFGFETKNHLKVIPLSIWFAAIDPSILSAKFYGVMEMFLVWGVFFLCVRRLATNQTLGTLIFLIFILDTELSSPHSA